MKEIKETTYKGTRILIGNEKRTTTNLMAKFLMEKTALNQLEKWILDYEKIQQTLTFNSTGKQNFDYTTQKTKSFF
jgi:hypothetical protein